MRASSAILAGALCATAVLAAPNDRFSRRSDDVTPSSQAPVKAHAGAGNIDVVNSANEETTTNWSGVILSGTGLTEATGTFTVPSISIPAGGSASTTYWAAPWVGLDGTSSSCALFQTGLYAELANGVLQYSSWAWWLPDNHVFFTGITFKPGDTVTTTVKASGLNGGTATIVNHSTGKSVSHTFSGQSTALCGKTAEWIMEDPALPHSLEPYPAHDQVVFTGASAVEGGKTVDSGAGTVVNMVQNNAVLSSGAISGSSEVTCTYH